MDDGYSLISVIIFIGFVFLDAAFYGFGSAIQNVNVGNLEKEMLDGNKKAQKLLRVVNRPTRFVNSIQILSNVIGMIVGAYVLMQLKEKLLTALSFIQVFPNSWLSVMSILGMGILLMLLLVSFGIIIPKRCAAKNPEAWGYRMLPVVTVIAIPLMPFIFLVSVISWLVLKLVGIDMNTDDENVTEEDIMSMVNEGHEQGVLEASEAEMITNIFEFTDKEAGDIMTHRKNLVALDASMILRDAVDFILNTGNNSRYPVYEKDVDDVVGILHMKDAVIYAGNEAHASMPIGLVSGLLREAHFIPETRNINSLFKEMQSQKIHMEIVVDEYGQTAGIVTMEDILEEIVGNILDEYDVDEDYIVKLDEESYLLSGMTPLEEVADALGIQFEEEESDTYDTLNGFLISKLDRIPQENEDSEIEYEGYVFKIMKVENKMIHSVKAMLLKGNEEQEGMEEVVIEE